MNDKTQILNEYVVGLADDSLILGQRLAEWCSKGPFLEEDLAISNVALDYLGRAQMFYDYAAELQGGETTTDEIAFLRDSRQLKNNLINELPIGDFAYTMARQFMLDCFGVLYLQALTDSSDETLAAIAGKAIKESHYHLRRSSEWVIRLGDGTDESHQRIQKAFDELWGYTGELFEMTEEEIVLLSENVSVDKPVFQQEWQAQINDVLNEATINLPDDEWRITGGRKGIHTEHLGQVLAEMQYLQRTYPGKNW